ncbi:glycosyl hydrolase [Planosporangium thailandense]|uniref:glycosyl hydrolase n=1 Tax=Planosporangium thailandense TaxID=765197 RepID=UPI001F106EF9|nr:glycosyl hydrolase [Planosporangium thailandense]
MSVVALGLSAAPAAAAKPQPRPHQVGLLASTAHHKSATTSSGTMKALAAPGGGDADGGEGANEIQEGADQYAEARTSPGVVAPGAYSAAWAQLQSLRKTGGNWTDETALPYNSDDPRYRDVNSNSSGGAGQVTGRITGLAADDSGYVYAGAANGGVWRSRTGGGKWEPISDKLPSPATGDLRLDGKGRLWYATGEANTSSTAFIGSGVYVLADPRHGQFQPGNRVGGTELESTIISKLRFIGDRVWAATNRGVWSHSTINLSGPWTAEFIPNPDYLPTGPLAADPNAPYKNITNDVIADPKDPSKVILAVGWRSGDAYNGFYTKQNGAWQRVTLGGDIASDAANVGAVTFAAAADGSKFYAIEQSPKVMAANPDSGLMGIYEADGSPFGPWHLVADYKKLAASGSALTGAGYMPGIQSWYNQFLQVDPTDPNHVYMGLEEVFETKDAGATWTTPGPYWNFGFPCWNIDPGRQTGDCHQTIHADQHAVTIGTYKGRSYVIVGDDGGAYRRPVRGQADASGHATDWTSLGDGTMDVLQYYSVGVGLDRNNKKAGIAISGGLQDNGQSVKRPGDKVMGSNFGGDGGDTIVDPANGCNIAEEYVYLAMSVTNNCAVNDGSWTTDPAKATTRQIAPPDSKDSLARFIAPFTYDPKDTKTWVAGGQHVWVQHKGWNIQSGDDWTNVFDLGDGHVATAVSVSGGTAYVGWCGPCNNQGFTRGIAVGNVNDPASWHQLNLPVEGQLPNRYISGFDVDPANANHVVVAINGFSRRWTEGPGAGIGHVFESRDAGATWTDISGDDLPDVPADSVKMLRGGGLVLATDLGVLYRASSHGRWTVLGRNFPTTAVMQIKTGPFGKLYAATHGRGIWSYDLSRLDD